MYSPSSSQTTKVLFSRQAFHTTVCSAKATFAQKVHKCIISSNIGNRFAHDGEYFCYTGLQIKDSIPTFVFSNRLSGGGSGGEPEQVNLRLGAHPGQWRRRAIWIAPLRREMSGAGESPEFNLSWNQIQKLHFIRNIRIFWIPWWGEPRLDWSPDLPERVRGRFG